MRTDLNAIRSDAEYEEALVKLERLWGAGSGTAAGERLDLLATLIDAYEAEHDPIDPPRWGLATSRFTPSRSAREEQVGAITAAAAVLPQRPIRYIMSTK